MKPFILGACVGLTLAGAVGVGAQLAPFDAPLDEQIQAQRADWYLRTLREVEAMERENRRLADTPLVSTPIPRRPDTPDVLEEHFKAQARAQALRDAAEERRVDRLEREVKHLELLNALDDLKRRR